MQYQQMEVVVDSNRLGFTYNSKLVIGLSSVAKVYFLYNGTKIKVKMHKLHLRFYNGTIRRLSLVGRYCNRIKTKK